MSYQVGDRVRVTRGDMRGRIGVVGRILQSNGHIGQTYGIRFSGEEQMSNFRVGNVERANGHESLPEFLELGSEVCHLLGNEPYELISGGFMGKRRRYWLTNVEGVARFATSSESVEPCDFRRFPVDSDGGVVAGIWSRFRPHEASIRHILSFMAPDLDHIDESPPR